MSKQKKIGFVLFLVLAFGVFFMLNSHEVTGAAKQTIKELAGVCVSN